MIILLFILSILNIIQGLYITILIDRNKRQSDSINNLYENWEIKQ